MSKKISQRASVLNLVEMRHIIKKVVRKKFCNKYQNTSHLVSLHGSAAKHWLYRGDDECGSGWRKAAKKWRVGESLKQNAFLLPKRGHREQTVSGNYHFVYYSVVVMDYCHMYGTLTPRFMIGVRPRIKSHTSYNC